MISEDGRLFLVEQLQRLTPAHVRALFTAARVDRLDGSSTRTRAGRDSTAIDDWVAVFQDKVRQIEAHRCRPIS